VLAFASATVCDACFMNGKVWPAPGLDDTRLS
jgi:hypothetical protein